MDYRGIPLCNRGRRLTTPPSLFIAAPFDSYSLYPFFHEFLLRQADLISSTPSVAYNFPRVSEENRYLLENPSSLYIF